MRSNVNTKIYVLDTNVLLHNPDSLFHYGEHDVFIPAMVLKELNRKKRGEHDASRTARKVLRTLSRIIEPHENRFADDGFALKNAAPSSGCPEPAEGRLYFSPDTDVDGSRDGNRSILAEVMRLSIEKPRSNVVLVTKDISLQVPAALHGIATEDYEGDRPLHDMSQLYTGSAELPGDFRSRHAEIHSWEDGGRAYHEITVQANERWYPNQCLYLPKDDSLQFRVMKAIADKVTLAAIDDYRERSVWGTRARDHEQNFALNVLMDRNVDLVTLSGPAGSGKTLLALAAGLAQVMDRQRYREIFFVHAAPPLVDDIGHVEGRRLDSPLLGLADNVELLSHADQGGNWGTLEAGDIVGVESCIKLRSFNSLRDRTILNRYIVIDEAQNMTPCQLSKIIASVGPGSKLVCIGNLDRIENPYLDETTSGLTYLIERFKHWPHAAHVTLVNRTLSRIAAFSMGIADPEDVSVESFRENVEYLDTDLDAVGYDRELFHFLQS